MEDRRCREPQMKGTLERYVAGALPELELASFEEHLVECRGCREEVQMAAALREAFIHDEAMATSSSAHARRRWLRFAVGGSALAAAAVAGILLVGPAERIESPGVEPTHRDGPGGLQAEGILAMEIMRPADDTALAADSVAFEWEAASPDALYSLSLTDANGDLVWRSTSRDTTVDLPQEVPLKPGVYFWYVDARLEDGRTASTGAHTFTIER